MKVENKDLQGAIEGFPVEVVEAMCKRQVAQGNAWDPSVFHKKISVPRHKGGFDWEKTPEGFLFWDLLIGEKEWDLIKGIKEI